jgi:DNA polymerase-3 subunit gamma/tau
MLNSLSQTSQPTVESAPAQPQEQVSQAVDESCEQKIEANREAILAAILRERPRFVVAFERMLVHGNVVEVEVPSQTLYEEIMRSKTEILMQMARAAGVEGMLEMDITINEEIKASRPIKLEDRIKFMTEKNPLLLELKKALDMEYE